MNNDLISRSALKEEFAKHEDRKGYLIGDWEDIIDNALPIETTIENLISTLSVEELKATTRFKVDTPSGEAISFRREKTGEPERPHGEWITTGEEQGALGIIYKIRKCSKCGWDHSLVIPDNFCPNCGADMRKEAEKDEQSTNDN